MKKTFFTVLALATAPLLERVSDRLPDQLFLGVE